MATNISFREPNLVKVTRVRKGPGDLNPIEHFVGYLVDQEGNDVDTPEVGFPIYLSGDETKLPWLFASDPVYRLETYATHWEVLTELGNQYEIRSNRTVQ